MRTQKKKKYENVQLLMKDRLHKKTDGYPQKGNIHLFFTVSVLFKELI